MEKLELNDSQLLKFYIQIIRKKKPKEFVREVFRAKGLDSSDKSISAAYSNLITMYDMDRNFTDKNRERLKDELGINILELWELLQDRRIYKVGAKGDGNTIISQGDSGVIRAGSIGGQRVDSRALNKLQGDLEEWKNKYWDIHERYLKCVDRITK